MSNSTMSLALAVTLVAGWMMHDLFSVPPAAAQDAPTPAAFTECVGMELPYTSARDFGRGGFGESLTIPDGWHVAGGSSFGNAPLGMIILCR